MPLLLTNGADPAFIGQNAGSVVGAGFYVCDVYYDAQFWATKLFNCPTTILRVTLPESARIATAEEQERVNPLLFSWGREQGYIEKSVDTAEPTEKLLIAHHVSHEDLEQGNIRELGMDATLRGLMLAEQGYDGYVVEDGAVITNFELLTPSAFAVAKEPER